MEAPSSASSPISLQLLPSSPSNSGLHIQTSQASHHPCVPVYLHASFLRSMTSLRSCEASLLYSMVPITSLLEVLYPHALQNRALSWFFCYVSICLTGSFFSIIPHKYGPPQCPTFASLLYSLLDLFHSLRFCPQFLDR